MVLFNTFCSILFLLFCLFTLARPQQEDINVNTEPVPKDFNGFIMTVPDCEYQLFFANNTLTLHGDNWTNVLEETRHNFTNLMGQCKNEVNRAEWMDDHCHCLHHPLFVDHWSSRHICCVMCVPNRQNSNKLLTKEKCTCTFCVQM